MSVLIHYPYPHLNNLLILPNPQLRDIETPDTQVIFHRSLAAQNYTYVRENTAVDLVLTLKFTDVSRLKMDETRAWVRNYTGYYFRYTNHMLEQYKVRLINNASFTMTRMAVPCNPGRMESGEFELVLQGNKI